MVRETQFHCSKWHKRSHAMPISDHAATKMTNDMFHIEAPSSCVLRQAFLAVEH